MIFQNSENAVKQNPLFEDEKSLSKTYPLASIIILNYNGKSYLSNCLKSVMNNKYPNFEVILVDNASTDSSLKEAQKRFGSDPRLKIVQSKINTGFAGGNNLGFKYCRGEYVVFLNNDTLVEEDWLTKLVEAMQNDPSIGLAQSKIINMHNDEIQNAGWLFSNYLVRKHSLGEKQNIKTKFFPVFEVSVASGASMIASRALIDEVGLFDSKIPFFYDDTLLSFKAWLAKKRVVAVDDSHIRHIMGATSSWNIERTTYNLYKAKTCLLFDLYFRYGDIIKAVFVNLDYTLISIVFSLKNYNLSAVYGTLKGLGWSFRNFGYLWQNRLKHWSGAKLSPAELKSVFVKVNIPTALYFLPSKLSNDYFDCAAEDYAKKITKL